MTTGDIKGVLRKLEQRLRILNYPRDVDYSGFDYLLDLLKDDLQHQDTFFRKSITPCERLLLTLRFLASGNSFASFYYEFRLGKSTVHRIVNLTSKLIWMKLQPLYMVFPNKQRWTEIADGFWNRCKFPNCLGAVDGKHVRITCPPCSGSQFFNYKKYFSLVLLAVTDAEYRFVYIDVGSFGSSCDSTVFQNSKLGRLLRNGRLDLPDPRPWPGTSEESHPFTFIGDEAFGLSEHMMRPYSNRTLSHLKRIFNFRLSKARRIVECTFGILSSKWRIFLGSMQLAPANAVAVIKAACVLHNFVREREGITAEEALINVPTQRGQASTSRPTVHALQRRDKLAAYFTSRAGAVN